MNKADIVDVLTAAAAGDRRTVGDADVEIWFQVIGDIPKDFAISAVVAHFRDRPGVWLEPGHVAERWRLYRRDRTERAVSPLAIESSSVSADGGIGIESRELKNGDKEFRFFRESDTGQACCGLWRSTVAEARQDGQRRTA